jgi:hypothetical protein
MEQLIDSSSEASLEIKFLTVFFFLNFESVCKQNTKVRRELHEVIDSHNDGNQI